MVTEADMRCIAGAKASHPTRHALAAAFNRHAAAYGVISQKSIAQFLANVGVETGGFTKLSENLNYSAARLHEVWPNRFPTLASARPYANNPKALAEKVYGGRMGNEPGEGFTYIGRGPGQATGEDNYELAKDLTEIDFIAHPEWMADPDKGMQAALALWRQWGLNALAGKEQTTLIRKRWNGGSHGLNEVKANYARAMKLTLSLPIASLPAVPGPDKSVAGKPASEDGYIDHDPAWGIPSAPIPNKTKEAASIFAVIAAAAGAWYVSAQEWFCGLPLISMLCGG